MRTIYKYEVTADGNGECTIALPRAHRIIEVASKYGNLFFWAIVDTDREKVDVRFVVYGTGWPIADTDLMFGLYLGTAHDGVYVWHLFEIQDLGTTQARAVLGR